MSVNPYSFPHDSYLAFFLNATPPPPPHHTPVGMKCSSVLSSAQSFSFSIIMVACYG